MHKIDELKIVVYSLEFSFKAMLDAKRYEEAIMIQDTLAIYYKKIQNEQINTTNHRRKKKIKTFKV